MPAFLSNLTETDFSWLQKRHGKFVGRGSFYTRKISRCTRATGLNTDLFGSLRLPRRLLAFTLRRIRDDVATNVLGARG